MECAADDAGWGQAAGTNKGQDSNGKPSNNHVGRAVAVTASVTSREQRLNNGSTRARAIDSAWTGDGWASEELQLSALGRGRGASKLGLAGTK